MLEKESLTYKKFIDAWWPNFAVRVENKVGSGTPDIYYSDGQGRGNWIEIKSIATYKSVITIRPAQVAWHLRCWNHHGCSLLLTECWGNGQLFLFLGRDLRKQMWCEDAYAEIPNWDILPDYISPTTANINRWRRY